MAWNMNPYFLALLLRDLRLIEKGNAELFLLSGGWHE